MIQSTPHSSEVSLREFPSSRGNDGFDGGDPSNNSPGQHANGITIPDAGLLFSGYYQRSGLDLVISGPDRKFTIANYFAGQHHRALFSPDGASLSGDVVDALTGQTTYAQASPAAAAAQSIGHVVKLNGSADVVRNGVAVTLNIGDNVFKGDVVQCGADSSLGLSFVDGTAFSLSSNARMVLNEMVYDPLGSSNSSLLSLVQGTISFVAGETAKHGSMKIDTPVATMGIRGTAVLVEIAADNGPTKFSVLVEPGLHTGSFVLLDRVTGATLGSISQAGLMTLVTPTGRNQFTISEQLKTQADLQAEKDLVQLVFSIAFPNFNLNDTNPHGIGSPGSGVTPFGTLGFYSFASALPPDFVQLTAATTPTPTAILPVDIFLQHKAEVTVANVTAFQSGGVADTQSSIPGLKSFAIAPRVTISDPVASEVTVPFVAGSARIVGAAGPSSIPARFDLLGLASVDPTIGVVTYDPSTFRFLGVNETAQYVIAFDSQVGNNIIPETLLFTVNGLDDAPIFSAPDARIAVSALAGKAGSSDPVTQVALLPFRDLDFSDTGSGYSASVLHAAATGVTTGLPHDPAALEAMLRAYLTPGVTKTIGSTDGVLAETFSAPESAFDYLAKGETVDLIYTIQIRDAAGATSTETLTVTITGAEHAPVLAADPLVHPVADQTSAGPPPLTVDTAAGSLSFTDVVLSETHAATASLASELVSGGGTLPAAALAALQSAFTVAVTTDSTGIGSGTLGWNFSAPEPLFAFLRAGQTLTVTYDVTLSDAGGGAGNGLSATQPVTIVITGTPNVPEIIGETDPAPLVVQPIHPLIENLQAGVSTNSLGLPTETFNAMTAGPADDNGEGFGNFFSTALNAHFSGAGFTGIVNGTSRFSEAPSMGPSGVVDTTNYLSVIGTETIHFDQIENAFGLYWGSIDPFNEIQFFNGATLVATFTGADLSPPFGNHYVQFFGLGSFDTVVLQSRQAFEIENMSAGFITPPGTQPLEPREGTLTATDAHVGDTLTGSVTGPATITYNGSTTLPANVDVSGLIAASAVSFDTVTTNGGPEILHWVYNPGVGVDFLKAGDTLTITYVAQVDDGSGSAGSQPLTITVVGDSGTHSIADGAPLELSGSAGPGENVTFQGPTGTLAIDDASHFAAVINGFTGNGSLEGSDQIDLKDIDFNSASFSKSFDSATETLSLSDGANSALLHFNGSYSAANFNFVSDGNGGTIVYDPPVAVPNANAAASGTAGTAVSHTLVATVPNETLTSQDGSMAFVFDFNGIGDATVRNFHSETDMLQFDASMFATVQAILAATHDDGHGNAVISLGSQDIDGQTHDAHGTITLEGVLKATLSLADFHIV